MSTTQKHPVLRPQKAETKGILEFLRSRTWAPLDFESLVEGGVEGVELVGEMTFFRRPPAGFGNVGWFV